MPDQGLPKGISGVLVAIRGFRGQGVLVEDQRFWGQIKVVGFGDLRADQGNFGGRELMAVQGFWWQINGFGEVRLGSLAKIT